MTATYRLQLTPDFTFADAEALVPYFQRLGVSHLYLSPITQAVPGSTHGYDVIDPTAINRELGGRESFESLRKALVEAKMGLLLDVVPNHAGAHPENERWQHTLAFGPHAGPQFFDIDWAALGGKVLLPFLGRPYGEAVDEGEVTLVFEKKRLFAAYYDHRFALSPATYADVLDHALGQSPSDRARALVADYRELSPDTPERAEALRPRLCTLADQIDLDKRLETLRGAALHEILEKQHWRLAQWRTSAAELNYRRFFQINDLVALRQEDDAVFEETHRLIIELAHEEGVDGLRIDHIDGMADPQIYLTKLREQVAPTKVWVEKILAGGETLPSGWPVAGTTGYAFMNDVMNVLTDPAGEEPLTKTYHALVPEAASYDQEAHHGKTDVMQTTLAADRRRLTRRLYALARADYHTRDLTEPALDEALKEITAAFDRYRTYLPHDPDRADTVLRDAIDRAREHTAFPDRAPYGFIRQVALGQLRDGRASDSQAWTRRFQQFTAPVAAKGVEDAAFYRYNRLAALCEVGGEPDDFGCSKEDFHHRCAFRAARCPHTLLATATHDHKRGEDLRMRLIALSERPDRWRKVVERLSDIGQRHRGAHGPGPADAYLFYQVLAALWTERDDTDFTDRLIAYMEKACRESARHTRWTNPDESYEADVERFVHGLIEDPDTDEVLVPFARAIARSGFTSSLSQGVLKCTTPGVPDVYQGRELWDLSLVDPDNRRPVDYERRRQLLGTLAPAIEAPRAGPMQELADGQDEGAKLYVTTRLLRLRRKHSALFTEGSYEPLSLRGAGADRWIAFARQAGSEALVVAVPRFPERSDEHTGATIPFPDVLAGRSWTDVLSGQDLAPTSRLDLSLEPLPWTVLLAHGQPAGPPRHHRQ